MGTLKDLNRGIEIGRNLAETLLAQEYVKPDMYYEQHLFSTDSLSPEMNQLCCGDNLEYMRLLLSRGYKGRLKLIYIDPPFFTKAKYNATISLEDENGCKLKAHHLAYDDTFERNLEYYVSNITVRLILMKELLRDDGMIWVHLDWHSSHYVRVIMDEIFGEKNFINDVIWKYKSGGSSDRHFSRKHDTLLLYSKSSKYQLNIPKEKSYNRGLKPYSFKGVEEYRDEYGWYTLVNMKDVWSIDMVGRTSKERTGYATQKPIELMKNIITASSEDGDIVADFFCGSGSLLEQAQKQGRRWIGCDTEELATALAKKRLDILDADYIFCSYNMDTLRKGRADVRLTDFDELESGKRLCTFEVTRFDPVIDMGNIPLKERARVEQSIRANSMQMIDYIMVDPFYNGDFKAEMIVYKDLDSIRFITGGDFALIIVDVLGKEYLCNVIQNID